MGGRRWEQFAAVSGLIFVVVLCISIVLPGEAPPQIDAQPDDIQSFYVTNAGSIQAAAYLTGLAAFFFLFFLGRLRSALARAEGEAGRLSAVAFGGGILALALALGSTVVGDVLAIRIAAIGDPAITRALFEMQILMGNFSAFGVAALVAATSVVALQTRLLPRWLAYAGEALTLGWLIAGVGAFVESGAFSATGIFGLIVFLAWLVWVAAVSVSLLGPSTVEGTLPA